jgi:hypothetical protein
MRLPGEMLVHGSCAARDGEAVLFLGPPGTGKSDLVLRLLHRPGWRLVADDQVAVEDGATPPRVGPAPALRGMLEVRGLGILADLPVAEDAALRLAVELAPRDAVPRLPEPGTLAVGAAALPRLALHAFDASAPEKVEAALDCATGRARLHAGAFA